jgi:hypothetical protein
VVACGEKSPWAEEMVRIGDAVEAHHTGGTVAGQHGVERLEELIAAQPEHAQIPFGASAREGRGGGIGVRRTGV